ncbi:MAG: N-formylglutamate amidohydrolase [Alphaproteobacteria bacterium]|nr:MAG: N-formylglutamate amidohydrolase [Alphaproteobacteria bacterium]
MTPYCREVQPSRWCRREPRNYAPIHRRCGRDRDAAFIHQHYSRLVIDCNRDPLSPEAIPSLSDDTPISGNAGISSDDRPGRIAAIHEPYQGAIALEIERRESMKHPTILVALHSFTPSLAGVLRPWDIGVLHDGRQDSFARALIEALRIDETLEVADNEPYRMDSTDYTVPLHAFERGLLYAELEIRQDLITFPSGQARWCRILANVLPAAYEAVSKGSK